MAVLRQQQLATCVEGVELVELLQQQELEVDAAEEAHLLRILRRYALQLSVVMNMEEFKEQMSAEEQEAAPFFFELEVVNMMSTNESSIENLTKFLARKFAEEVIKVAKETDEHEGEEGECDASEGEEELDDEDAISGVVSDSDSGCESLGEESDGKGDVDDDNGDEVAEAAEVEEECRELLQVGHDAEGKGEA